MGTFWTREGARPAAGDGRRSFVSPFAAAVTTADAGEKTALDHIHDRVSERVVGAGGDQQAGPRRALLGHDHVLGQQGGLGVLAGFAVVAATGLPVVLVLALAAMGAAIGFLDPDSKLARAARARQNLITIEMGFKVPELWTYAMTRGVETSLRLLAERPGGPFVSEVRRAVRLYDMHGSLAPGLKAMAERNTGEQIREFAVQLRMAAERGGRLLEALDVLATSARRAMGRYIRARTAQNLRAVRDQIMLWMGGLVFLLILGPVALLIAQELLGG